MKESTFRKECWEMVDFMLWFNLRDNGVGVEQFDYKNFAKEIESLIKKVIENGEHLKYRKTALDNIAKEFMDVIERYINLAK